MDYERMGTSFRESTLVRFQLADSVIAGVFAL